MLRASLTTSTVVALLGLTAGAAHAHGYWAQGVPDPLAGFQASENVTFVQRLPQHQGSSGGRLHEGRFYVTDPRGVHVYDVADPLAPVHLGSLTLFQSNTTNLVLGQEDPDTNGEILLLDGTNPDEPGSAQLQVVDVADPSDMSILASVDATAHTWTCIAQCTYAYGREGEVVDLRDPSAPVLLGVNWREAVGIGAANSGPGYTHDVTEVRPGRAMSAGQTSTWMDTTDPADPKRLTAISTTFHTFGYHGVEWADEGRDELVVLGTEIAPDDGTNEAGSDCQDEGSVIETWRTTDVLAAEERLAAGASTFEAEFEKAGTWRVQGRGIGIDGQAPAHVLYCAHWFDLHPEWDDGGLLAAGYYEWGTRIVEVATDGSMSEFGWFLPSDGYTSSSYWIDRDVLYTLDYVRGLDILQVDVAAAADPSPEGQVAGGEAELADLPEAAAGADGPTTPATGSGAVGAALGTLGLGWGLRRRRRA